eukprot:jgi/Ulvmu1/7767/UM039_0076.1
MSVQPATVAFCHLDLGLGGAERFVVDAALELQAAGHDVKMYTSHYDQSRCLEDTQHLSVHTVGVWIPRTICGLFTVLCSWARMTAIALHLAWIGATKKQIFDVIIVDQVSVIVPLLKWTTSSHVIFYGHFPDLHLATRASPLRRAYRRPFDALEGASTAAAHTLLVNSRFTLDTFSATFPRLAASLQPRILYPAVAVPSDKELAADQASWESELEPELVNWIHGGSMLLSLNRYERKKNIALALRALREVIDRHALSVGTCARARLVIAGGHDPRVAENVAHLRELRALAAELNLEDRVVFMTNVTEGQRRALISACQAMLYTPANEHFGIVPLEAMARACPVLAVASGGPLETVVHRGTGFLSEGVPMEFANAMVMLLTQSEEARAAMCASARRHVNEKFSRKVLAQEWAAVMADAQAERAARAAGGADRKRA